MAKIRTQRIESKAILMLPLAGCVLSTFLWAQADWRSGQDSPVHDSDRQIPLSGETITLSDSDVSLTFDSKYGTLLEFTELHSGWHLQHSRELAQSFRLFAPTPDRSYNPVLGARNTLASIEKGPDGSSLKLVWSNLESEYGGKLDIMLTGTVTLHGPDVQFDMEIRNNSGRNLSTIDWPILGSFSAPEGEPRMDRLSTGYGTGVLAPLSPTFRDERGYYGTNYPIQMGTGRYNIVTAGNHGLYIGTQDLQQDDVTRYTFELKPGFSDSFDQRVPSTETISAHPARIVLSIEHFPFLRSGKSMRLAPIVLSPFEGDWHRGAEVYRRWRASWFQRPLEPAWITGVNSWQQIQINSSEDDLRTPYRDLPARAEQAAKAGVNAIQLVGWNNGGQDRGNPSHDTDPRLGTWQDLKAAIAKIEHMGVHVILFNKYTWVDTTSPDWDKLKDHVAYDPNGWPYVHPGYQYQTPEQLADINTRRLTVACTPDPFWQDLSAKEFKKTIDLGATGMLYDEAFHHANANFCFTHKDGELIATPIYKGDSMLGRRFHQIVKDTVGETNFLFGSEYTYDLEQRYYSVSYFRILPRHIPIDRYNDPSAPMMIAVTGFDDREMINQALRYRYIISYEPFNFKGNLSDFPATLSYGLKVDALRRRYREYVWDAEFRDNQEATVTAAGKAIESFATYARKDGKHAAIVVNEGAEPLDITVQFASGGTNLQWTSPESPDLKPVEGAVHIEPRSVVIVTQL